MIEFRKMAPRSWFKTQAFETFSTESPGLFKHEQRMQIKRHQEYRVKSPTNLEKASDNPYTPQQINDLCYC